MSQAEGLVSTIQDPHTYYVWRRVLESESRALDFEEKWGDSLKSVNPPPRLGSATQINSDRWVRALTGDPDPKSDVWEHVRDWEEFQNYIQAALAIFESPLYEGRAGPTVSSSMRGEKWALEVQGSLKKRVV